MTVAFALWALQTKSLAIADTCIMLKDKYHLHENFTFTNIFFLTCVIFIIYYSFSHKIYLTMFLWTVLAYNSYLNEKNPTLLFYTPDICCSNFISNIYKPVILTDNLRHHWLAFCHYPFFTEMLRVTDELP